MSLFRLLCVRQKGCRYDSYCTLIRHGDTWVSAQWMTVAAAQIGCVDGAGSHYSLKEWPCRNHCCLIQNHTGILNILKLWNAIMQDAVFWSYDSFHPSLHSFTEFHSFDFCSWVRLAKSACAVGVMKWYCRTMSTKHHETHNGLVSILCFRRLACPSVRMFAIIISPI